MKLFLKYIETLTAKFAPLIHTAEMRYRAAFSVREIETSKMLQAFYGISLFTFFMTFSTWISQQAITREAALNGSAVCWPYFPDCTKLYFFNALPEGYSQGIFYMVLFAMVLFAVYCVYKKKWVLAHVILLLLFIWKVFVMFVLSGGIQGGVNYYHLLLTAAFLFVPYKEYFVSLSFVLAYFTASIIKIDETWVLGTYFTSLQTGLPIFGDTFAPFFTNLVICMQIVGSWFLLSRHAILQKIALLFFIIFHVYSGVLVGYAFPAFVLPTLVILFGPLYKPFAIPSSKHAWIGWAYIVVLLAFSIPGHLIVGDQRLTQEGSRFGLNLFDANHQCVATITSYSKTDVPIQAKETSARPGVACEGYICVTRSKDSIENGLAVHQDRLESPVAWQRCSAYRYFLYAKYSCNNPKNVRVSLQLDHSIDGGPFYRIVDEKDVCDLTYHTFQHNDWIKLPPEAPVVGYPVKNFFRYSGQRMPPRTVPAQTATSSSNLIVLNELLGNDPIERTPLQKALTPYVPTFIFFWRSVWVCAILLALYSALKPKARLSKSK